MKRRLMKGLSLVMATFVIAFALLAPVQVSGQGRGRGLDKKAGKFINGHDARDGRWDGRGPRTGIIRARSYGRL